MTFKANNALFVCSYYFSPWAHNSHGADTGGFLKGGSLTAGLTHLYQEFMLFTGKIWVK